MGLEIKQLTRLQIIRYCEKLEKENKKMKEICDIYVPRVLKLEEEIKRLKEEIKRLNKESNHREADTRNLIIKTS